MSTQQPPPLPPGSAGQSLPPNPPPRAPGLGFSFLQSCLVAGCATILAPFVMLLGVVLIVVAVLAFSGFNESSLDAYTGGDVRIRAVRDGADGAGVIAIVPVQGAITGSGSPLDGDGLASQVAEQLRLAREDERVKAVLLQIDSPGGGLTASDQIHNEIAKTRRAGKIVVAWAGDMMVSGGYYVAVAAEGVMASPTTTVGSIGVVMQHFQASELMKKLGVAADPVVSVPYKDIGSMYREMTGEERGLLQKYVDDSHQRFVAVVSEGRGMSPERVATLADGRIYTAEQALADGLVDRIGYIEDAIEWIEEKAGEEDMRVVAFRRMFSLGDLFREVGYGAGGAVVERAAETPSSPRVLAR